MIFSELFLFPAQLALFALLFPLSRLLAQMCCGDRHCVLAPCLCSTGIALYQRGMLLDIIPIKKVTGTEILEMADELSRTNFDLSEFGNSLVE